MPPTKAIPVILEYISVVQEHASPGPLNAKPSYHLSAQTGTFDQCLQRRLQAYGSVICCDMCPARLPRPRISLASSIIIFLLLCLLSESQSVKSSDTLAFAAREACPWNCAPRPRVCRSICPSMVSVVVAASSGQAERYH
jgi:hypothetical protein